MRVAPAVLVLLMLPVGALGAGVDSLETESLPAGSVNVRAIAETRSDAWRGPRSRLRFLAVVGADTVLELSARAGPVACAVRADPGIANGWVAAEHRSWQLVVGGVRAAFGAGAILGRRGAVMGAPASPPRGGLVRMTPSTSLWLPTQGAGIARVAGSVRVAVVAWEGVESVRVALGGVERGRWRVAAMAGRASSDAGDDLLASLALGVRGGDHSALLEVGAREAAVHAALRATMGRVPRWTIEMGMSTTDVPFGGQVASSNLQEGRRLRMGVARSGRFGPVRMRASLWGVAEREMDATRERRRLEVEVRAPVAGAVLRADARLDHDDGRVWRGGLTGIAPTAERLRQMRLRLGYESSAGGVRQFVRSAVLLGPEAGRGVLLQWGMNWRGHRVRVDARVSAAALAPGQKAWFARPDMAGRETLGVATGTVSDAALRVGIRILGVTWWGWVGAGSRRSLRAYAGASFVR